MGSAAPVDIDARITQIAAQQHGVVTRDQLIAASVPVHRIEYRLRQGRLRRLYPGVYRTGAVVSAHEPAMAAVLACGQDAVLSYCSAAVPWGVLHATAPLSPVEISVRSGRRAPGPGVRVHRISTLFDDEVTHHDNLPLTTPARTLLDLAAVLDARALESAVARAERKGLADRKSILRLLDRHPARRGVKVLRAIVGDGGSPTFTRSEAEARFLSLLRRTRLPRPEANVIVQGYEVDFLWRRERLIAEIDGFAFHSSRGAFERDRRLDALLGAAGFGVLRMTWHQVTREPEAVLIAVAQALAVRQVP